MHHMNTIFQIVPRKMKKAPLWIFDDPQRGLIEEPFLEDASAALDKIAESVGAKNEMVLLFSATAIPDCTTTVERVGSGEYAETAGAFYRFYGKKVWLCPAVAKYFRLAPEKIFIKAFPTTQN